MKTIHRHLSYKDIPTTYSGLFELFMLRPVHDEVALANATEVIDLLAGHKLNKDQEEYLETLSDLVEKYEETHHPMILSHRRGIKALKALLKEHHMKAADLSRLLKCHRSLGSKILNGDRSLTTDHLRILTDYFKVSADLFL